MIQRYPKYDPNDMVVHPVSSPSSFAAAPLQSLSSDLADTKPGSPIGTVPLLAPSWRKVDHQPVTISIASCPQS